jgi:hypothetical protein
VPRRCVAPSAGRREQSDADVGIGKHVCPCRDLPRRGPACERLNARFGLPRLHGPLRPNHRGYAQGGNGRPVSELPDWAVTDHGTPARRSAHV